MTLMRDRAALIGLIGGILFNSGNGNIGAANLFQESISSGSRYKHRRRISVMKLTKKALKKKQRKKKMSNASRKINQKIAKRNGW